MSQVNICKRLKLLQAKDDTFKKIRWKYLERFVNKRKLFTQTY